MQLFMALAFSALATVQATRSLSAQITSWRTLKSVYGTYLYADWTGSEGAKEWYVHLTQERAVEAQWHIEDHGGQVSLMSAAYPGMYLHASPSGLVNVAKWSLDQAILWTPVKMEKDRWSLKSVYGNWLRMKPDGYVALQRDNNEEETFWINYAY